MDKKNKLIEIVGAENVLDDPKVLATWSQDESFVASRKPWFVVRPQTVDEIQALVMEELPQIPLYHGANITVAPKWLAGMTPSRSTSLPTLWVEYWQPK